jgi:LysR family transcriptional regulator, transcriptional activator of the cysJI operon
MLDLVKKARFLDPKLFTAFAAAAEVQNFTNAAKVAHMTQSGISQHIARLEEQIKRPLFKRIGKQVVLTETGQALLSYIREHVAELDTFFERIHEENESLTGVVSYAMPPSCLLSGHFSELLAKRVAHPNLRLKVTLASSPEVLELVVQDRIDFGFVTFRPLHTSIELRPFCDEEYVLVSSDRELMEGMKPAELFEEPIVGYPGADVYYNMWLRHHVRDHRDYLSLLRAGEINSIEGAIKMVVGGLGSAVIPRHCIQPQLDAGQVFAYQSGNPKPLTNTIYVAQIRQANQSRRIRQVLSWFYEMLQPAEVADKPTAVTRRVIRESGIRKRAEPSQRRQ